MITKYTEYIKESLSTKTDIKKWLDEMKIKNYTINDDLTVDVECGVDISYKNLREIPVKFNNVNCFDCSINKLTSLKGCPNIVNDFYCNNNLLTSLEGCPNIVNDCFYCDSNKLTSLEGCPTHIKYDFGCGNNKLTSLKGCPTVVSGYFDFRRNPHLEDINSLDSKIVIKSIYEIDVSQEVFDKYFEEWIDKDINIFNVLKDKVSNDIKIKYDFLFNAKNFDLI